MFPVVVLVWTVASASAFAADSVHVSKIHVPQNFSFSMCRANEALASCQTKKVRMTMEGTTSQSSAKGSQDQAHTAKYAFQKCCLSV